MGADAIYKAGLCFWRKVRVKRSGCWERKAAVHQPPKLPYGKFGFCGIHTTAHRFSWIYCFGQVPPGLQVHHRCDNPRCCNPFHLWVGTQKDNIQDMLSKGRRPHVRGRQRSGFGTQQHSAKLDEAKVREARRLYATSVPSTVKLGRRYGVTPLTINRAIKGVTWKHV